MFFSKEKRFLNNIGRKFNPVLFAKLEENQDTIGVYIAVKRVLQDASTRVLGRSAEEADAKWRGRGLPEMIGRIKTKTESDPRTTFFLLVLIHARLSKKAEFEEFFRELLSKDASQEIMDAMIFKNPNLNLQFIEDT